MMIATLRWRDEFKVEDAMKETYPDVFNAFGHVYGQDKEGCPVVCAILDPFCLRLSGLTVSPGTIYTVANDLTAAFSDVQGFIRCVFEVLSVVFACQLVPNHR